MSLETDLRTTLLADGTLAGLVGSRIYPSLAPQGAPDPYITFERVGANRPVSFAGAVALIEPRVTYTVHAATRDVCRQIVDRVVAVLHVFRGLAGSTQIRSAVVDSESESIAIPTGGSEDAVYQARVDVNVWQIT